MPTLKKFWSEYSPLAHIIGFLILAAFAAGGIWSDVWGFDERITSNSESISILQVQQRNVQRTNDWIAANLELFMRRKGVEPSQRPELEPIY